MKVLWLCNLMLPIFASEFNCSAPPYGGWIAGLLNDLYRINQKSLANLLSGSSASDRQERYALCIPPVSSCRTNADGRNRHYGITA